MDITLSNIVRKAGFNFRGQYDGSDENYDPVVYKFILEDGLTLSSLDAAGITAKIRAALTAANFNFIGAALERAQRAKGPDYWAFVIRVPGRAVDRLLDRDIHGNLIFANNKKRAA
jgi:hypothetical protein